MSTFIQLAINASAAGATTVLAGLGFALIYQVVRFFHFAHGAIFTSSAYFVLLFLSSSGFPLPVSILAALVCSSALGCLIELVVYRPLQRKRASAIVLLLASLGIYVVIQNTISLVFGDQARSIRPGAIAEGIDVVGAKITGIQVTTICVAVVLVAGLAIMLKKTRIGRAIRAVANDGELACVSGIDSGHVRVWVFALGSALAGAAGILAAFDTDMAPTMGMNALMLGVIAVIVGGVESIPGVVLGALLLSVAQQAGAWEVGSQWQDAIAFGVLLVFLLLRPHGFLGRKLKKAIV
jgi:branched-chain amino acid transport system permease protein